MALHPFHFGKCKGRNTAQLLELLARLHEVLQQGRSNGAAQADKNGQTGFLEELSAYWRLCDLYGEANAVWESGGVATEYNDSAGYDLRYRPAPDKEWRRVEVKAGWADRLLVAFQLSAGELAAGRPGANPTNCS